MTTPLDQDCPILLSLRGREGEDSPEGELARAIFGGDRQSGVIAPVTDMMGREALGFLLGAAPRLARLLREFQPPYPQLWAEGEFRDRVPSAVFAHVLPDGSLRVVGVELDEGYRATVHPLAVTRKPSGLRGEPLSADWLDDGPNAMDRCLELLAAWMAKHLEVSPPGTYEIGGRGAAWCQNEETCRVLDLAVMMLACERGEARLLPV